MTTKFPDLPIVLFGHSRGGYSVCSVLTYHPEVKAVIDCSGFNRSTDIFEAKGKNQVGNGIYLMMPFVKLINQVKFGKYASNTALDGFAASDADVLIVHSKDDSMVPIEYGYDLYYEKYKDDPRFKFIQFEDAGHNYVFNDRTYIDSLFDELNKWYDTLDYDYTLEENRDRIITDREEYFKTHLDRDKWNDKLDKELFQEFLDFYDSNLE